MENTRKLTLADLKVDSFTSEISSDELAQIEAAGGGSYGTTGGSTRSYNCYSICNDNNC